MGREGAGYKMRGDNRSQIKEILYKEEELGHSPQALKLSKALMESELYFQRSICRQAGE